jgi:membrane protease YdiL (CAAX protease family)
MRVPLDAIDSPQRTSVAASSAHGPSAHSRPPLRRSRRLWLWVGLVAAWALLMRKFGGTDVYSLLGPYAAVVVLSASLLGRPRALDLLRPSLRGLGWGLGIGAAMVACTYPAYHLVAAQFPALRPVVASLYRATETTTLPEALAWVSVIVVAEETLWRGVGLHELTRHMGRAPAALLSVTSYALAQLGTGSWIVGLVALVCGTLWTLERIWLDDLFAALVSHWLWTTLVILLFPLT